MSLLLKNHLEKFIPVSEEVWADLERNLYTKTVAKKEFFTKEGDVENEVGFVLSGSLRHYYMKEIEEKTTYFYFENNLVSAYFSFLNRQPSQLSIEALEDCEIICFNYETMQMMYEKHNVWQIFGKKIAEYIMMGLEVRMVSLLIESPEERYMELLQSNKKKILERIPQQYIASYLGITPVSLSRIRNRVLMNEKNNRLK